MIHDWSPSSELMPLVVAAARLAPFEDFLRIIDRPGDVDAPDDSGRTALMWSARRMSRRPGDPSPQKVEALLKAGASPMALDKSNQPVLLYAIQGGCPESIDRLLKAGADIAWRQQGSGRTLLHYAVQLSEPDLTTFLDRWPLDVDVRDSDGRTPLMFAAMSDGFDPLEAASLLLKRGADKGAVDNLGRTALDHAKLSKALYVRDEKMLAMLAP